MIYTKNDISQILSLNEIESIKEKHQMRKQSILISIFVFLILINPSIIFLFSSFMPYFITPGLAYIFIQEIKQFRPQMQDYHIYANHALYYLIDYHLDLLYELLTFTYISFTYLFLKAILLIFNNLNVSDDSLSYMIFYDIDCMNNQAKPKSSIYSSFVYNILYL